jgi:hypothetical protein
VHFFAIRPVSKLPVNGLIETGFRAATHATKLLLRRRHLKRTCVGLLHQPMPGFSVTFGRSPKDRIDASRLKTQRRIRA